MKNMFVALLFILLFITTSAQTALLDPSFGNAGIVIAPPYLSSTTNQANAIVVQPDHKIIIAGVANSSLLLCRYLEDGTTDSSFAMHGIFVGPTHSSANDIKLQPDGKIISLGSVLNTGVANSDFLLLRLTSNGLPDSTFGNNGMDTISFSGGNDYGYAIALQPDGKIIAGGQMNTTFVALTRVLANGIIDTSFATAGRYIGSGPGTKAIAVSVMADGRITAGGITYSNAFMAQRFNADGMPDTSFNHTGIVTRTVGTTYNYCHGMSVSGSGKVTLAGSGTFTGTGSDFTLIKFDEGGLVDNSFGDSGISHIDFNSKYDEIWSLRTEDNGKMTIAGYSVITFPENFSVARVDSMGNPDSSFGYYGRIAVQILDSNCRALAVSVQNDGKTILAGYSVDSTGYQTRISVARFFDHTTQVIPVFRTENKIIVYPNPSSGSLRFNSLASPVIRNVTMSDISGSMLPVKWESGDREIEVKGVTTGIYTITFYLENGEHVSQKVVIDNNNN